MESDLQQDGSLENGNHFLTVRDIADESKFLNKIVDFLIITNSFDFVWNYPLEISGKLKDVLYCPAPLQLLKTETAHLNALVASAERDLESDNTIPEDARGKLRVAVGKSKMLLRKKFIQFKDLCFKNLGVESDVRYPVTSEDLAGYWDTIVIQIIQVYKIFEEVDILKKNNWEEPPIKTVNREKKKTANLNGDKAIISEAV